MHFYSNLSAVRHSTIKSNLILVLIVSLISFTTSGQTCNKDYSYKDTYGSVIQIQNSFPKKFDSVFFVSNVNTQILLSKFDTSVLRYKFSITKILKFKKGYQMKVIINCENRNNPYQNIDSITSPSKIEKRIKICGVRRSTYFVDLKKIKDVYIIDKIYQLYSEI